MNLQFKNARAMVVETGTKELQRDDGASVALPTYDAWIEAWTPGDTIKQRAEADREPDRCVGRAHHGGRRAATSGIDLGAATIPRTTRSGCRAHG